ncbi:MAG TPA: MBL fold metallo-hydrolase [Phycisphaerales bacterium]|nr:MBL fold metallo-hydrolase [Phycisphaerales bacterium]
MSTPFEAVAVADKVYWVGAVDWTVRNFHGYETSRGTTYNAYLVLADKVTLVDTVKAPFAGELMSRIASVIDPAKIEYIISNHAEMDHSGCLPQVLQAVRPEKVFVSAQGAKALADHFHLAREFVTVADGQTISMGNMTVQFLETRMCHWPDSMVSYLPERKLLFSQDAFGMHLASYERYADELDEAVVSVEASKYYANILLPLSSFVVKALDKVAQAKLAPEIVAPDHGPIWRRKEDIERIVGSYARWAAQKRTNKAVVVFDTMWGSTDKMARAVAEGLSAGGTAVKVMPMSACHRSDVATELLDAGAMLVGAPTINNSLFPTLADVLTYVKGLKPRGLVGGAFGSYGWSGESIKELLAYLEQMQVELVGEPVKVRYVPTDDDLARCRQLGQQVAQRLAGS